MRNDVRNLILLLPAFALAAHAETYPIVPGRDGGSSVRFVSKAPMESFDGVTHDVTGVVSWDEANGRVEIRAVVAMATLDTGIALRDRHMRENHLETDSYPEGTFEGGADLAQPPANPAQAVTLHGVLTLHGTSREVDIPATIARDRAGLRVDCTFPVALADYGIARPGFLAMKLGEVQRVEVSVFAAASPGDPGDAGTP